MVTSFIALVAAGVVGLAIAVPTRPATSDGSFRVETIPNPAHIPHGPTAIYRAFLKYGKTPPPELIETVMNHRAQMNVKRGSGSAVATPEKQDAAWLTPVQIGTPPQTLDLDFDSGSSDLWVFSTAVSPSQSRGHTTYLPGKSSTAELKSGYTWRIEYGDGSASAGTVYEDTVTVANVTFAKQAVETATKVSTSFVKDTSLDGLLGLAFGSINAVRPSAQKTFFENIKSTLDQPLWTADLRHGSRKYSLPSSQRV